MFKNIAICLTSIVSLAALAEPYTPSGCCVPNLPKYAAQCKQWNVPQKGVDRFNRCIQSHDGTAGMCSWDYTVVTDCNVYTAAGAPNLSPTPAVTATPVIAPSTEKSK